ncbi:MAG: hypothetical protein AAF492_05390 [Verrucomicrobiota bacterium]
MKITIAILSMAVMAAVVALIWTGSKGIEINSFLDVVRNPEATPDLDRFHKDIEDRVSTISGSKEEIARLVD